MMATDTIEPAIDDALRAHWIEQCRPPASISVNPADAADMARSWFERRSRERALLDLPAPIGAAISHWIDIYAGGVAVPFIPDATVPRGDVRLEEDA